MTQSTPRILCIDSSPRRLHELTETLGHAGYDVWTAQGASEAVCLASGLRFDVVVMDQVSSLSRSEVWDCLAESQPHLPILVHSGTSKGADLCRHWRFVSTSAPAQNPEVVLALLLMLLGEGSNSSPKLPDLAAA
jgi:CheY-like chemotaxis protein